MEAGSSATEVCWQLLAPALRKAKSLLEHASGGHPPSASCEGVEESRLVDSTKTVEPQEEVAREEVGLSTAPWVRSRVHFARLHWDVNASQQVGGPMPACGRNLPNFISGTGWEHPAARNREWSPRCKAMLLATLHVPGGSCSHDGNWGGSPHTSRDGGGAWRLWVKRGFLGMAPGASFLPPPWS